MQITRGFTDMTEMSAEHRRRTADSSQEKKSPATLVDPSDPVDRFRSEKARRRTRAGATKEETESITRIQSVLDDLIEEISAATSGE